MTTWNEAYFDQESDEDSSNSEEEVGYDADDDGE